MKIIRIMKGKETTKETVWMAFKPPATNSMAAIEEQTSPQKIFNPVLGSRLPPEVIMPTTKVAESAEVMKKMETMIMEIRDRKALMLKLL